MPNPKTPQKSIKEVAKNRHMKPMPMPFRLGHANSIDLVHDKGAALFYTGVNLDDTFSGLGNFLAAINRSIREIDRIFITHHYGDPCGPADRVKEVSGTVVHMSSIGKQIVYEAG